MRSWTERLAVPCARITVAAPTTSPSASYVGGYAYLPPDAHWPTIDDQAATFVCQVNFAEVPALPGFPTSGLLQWFVRADDNYYNYGPFDEFAGAVGFVVRWYAEPSALSQQPVDAPPPANGNEDAFGAPPCSALLFDRARSAPAWVELPPEIQDDPVWVELALARGEDSENDLELTYEEHFRGPLSEVGFWGKIGGHGVFREEHDPRGAGGAYPDLGDRAATVLVELAGPGVRGWGDFGVGHLFGDPARVALGDLSSVRFFWHQY